MADDGASNLERLGELREFLEKRKRHVEKQGSTDVNRFFVPRDTKLILRQSDAATSRWVGFDNEKHKVATRHGISIDLQTNAMRKIINMDSRQNAAVTTHPVRYRQFSHRSSSDSSINRCSQNVVVNPQLPPKMPEVLRGGKWVPANQEMRAKYLENVTKVSESVVFKLPPSSTVTSQPVDNQSNSFNSSSESEILFGAVDQLLTDVEHEPMECEEEPNNTALINEVDAEHISDEFEVSSDDEVESDETTECENVRNQTSGTSSQNRKLVDRTHKNCSSVAERERHIELTCEAEDIKVRLRAIEAETSEIEAIFSNLGTSEKRSRISEEDYEIDDVVELNTVRDLEVVEEAKEKINLAFGQKGKNKMRIPKIIRFLKLFPEAHRLIKRLRALKAQISELENGDSCQLTEWHIELKISATREAEDIKVRLRAIEAETSEIVAIFSNLGTSEQRRRILEKDYEIDDVVDWNTRRDLEVVKEAKEKIDVALGQEGKNKMRIPHKIIRFLKLFPEAHRLIKRLRALKAQISELENGDSCQQTESCSAQNGSKETPELCTRKKSQSERRTAMSTSQIKQEIIVISDDDDDDDNDRQMTANDKFQPNRQIEILPNIGHIKQELVVISSDEENGEYTPNTNQPSTVETNSENVNRRKLEFVPEADQGPSKRQKVSENNSYINGSHSEYESSSADVRSLPKPVSPHLLTAENIAQVPGNFRIRILKPEEIRPVRQEIPGVSDFHTFRREVSDPNSKTSTPHPKRSSLDGFLVPVTPGSITTSHSKDDDKNETASSQNESKTSESKSQEKRSHIDDFFEVSSRNSPLVPSKNTDSNKASSSSMIPHSIKIEAPFFEDSSEGNGSGSKKASSSQDRKHFMVPVAMEMESTFTQSRNEIRNEIPSSDSALQVQDARDEIVPVTESQSRNETRNDTPSSDSALQAQDARDEIVPVTETQSRNETRNETPSSDSALQVQDARDEIVPVTETQSRNETRNDTPSSDSALQVRDGIVPVTETRLVGYEPDYSYINLWTDSDFEIPADVNPAASQQIMAVTTSENHKFLLSVLAEKIAGIQQKVDSNEGWLEVDMRKFQRPRALKCPCFYRDTNMMPYVQVEPCVDCAVGEKNRVIFEKQVRRFMKTNTPFVAMSVEEVSSSRNLQDWINTNVRVVGKLGMRGLQELNPSGAPQYLCKHVDHEYFLQSIDEAGGPYHICLDFDNLKEDVRVPLPGTQLQVSAELIVLNSTTGLEVMTSRPGNSETTSQKGTSGLGTMTSPRPGSSRLGTMTSQEGTSGSEPMTSRQSISGVVAMTPRKGPHPVTSPEREPFLKVMVVRDLDREERSALRNYSRALDLRRPFVPLFLRFDEAKIRNDNGDNDSCLD
ncbi:uncharacterized protein LOC111052575 isoform X2 [Nilaparvata lugens]|uniref:uncharacterized protein LOC111052575 isoform X2 n=1 Tax=Nilaparvata lugens TaxID=108931 RepID=UPI00193D028F|nr:uncharacterized protein LOC111052575 isoform X2 [Nilaparvata lugens]